MKTKILASLAIMSAMIFTGCETRDPIYDATYDIMMSADNGTIKAEVGGAETELAIEGATVTLTATPTGDYLFKQWSVVKGNVALSPDKSANPVTFTMPAGAVEVKAEFEAISRTIKMDDDGNGTAEADPAEATAGMEVTITATPKGDYAFKEWVIVKGGDELLTDKTANPAKFTMPAGEVEIKAVFEAISRTIKIEKEGDGTAEADPAEATAGTEVTITATPGKGYVFKEWVVVKGGDELLADKTANPAKFSMPVGEVEIKAVFLPLRAIVLTNTDGRGTGKISVGGEEVSVAVEGSLVTITALPNENYSLDRWVVVSGGSDAMLSSTTTATATFEMPASAVEIRAEFRYSDAFMNRLAESVSIEPNVKASTGDRTFLEISLPPGVTIVMGLVQCEYSRESIRDERITTPNGKNLWSMSLFLPFADPTQKMRIYYLFKYDNQTSHEMYKEIAYTGATRNQVGSLYYENGVMTGVVYKIRTQTRQGLILYKNYEISVSMEDPTGGAGESRKTHYYGQGWFEYIKETFPNTWRKLGIWDYCDRLGASWFVAGLNDPQEVSDDARATLRAAGFLPNEDTTFSFNSGQIGFVGSTHMAIVSGLALKPTGEMKPTIDRIDYPYHSTPKPIRVLIMRPF